MKPCPFCGSSRAEVYACKNGDHRIRCECGAVGPPAHASNGIDSCTSARFKWDERFGETARLVRAAMNSERK